MIRNSASRLLEVLLSPLLRRLDWISGENLTVDRGTQQLLALTRRREYERCGTVADFSEVEFRCFSQNGEDGILWYIFSLIGATDRRCVEICAADGRQCNTANLIINHGWAGLLFDGDLKLIQQGRGFYGSHPDTFLLPPKLIHAWVTRENVNQLIRDAGVSGEIDLLSLDLDGVDYWIWEAIDTISPRVVVAEVQAIWDAEHAVTVPYADDFRTEYVNGFGVYSGASLSAFVKLGKRKGYRLVGVQRLGFNAFFIRNDVAPELFPEVDTATCLSSEFARWANRELLPLVRGREWEKV